VFATNHNFIPPLPHPPPAPLIVGYEPKKFQGGASETEYAVMFGPDLCGTSTRRTQVIFNYNGKKDGKLNNLQCKDQGKIETDRLSHRYTLIVRPDNTFETQIDGVKDISGSLFEKFDFLLPKTIKDPEASKPSDWVDDAEIADPSDTKPEGYDSIPRTIPDASKKKPEDWDDEEDGAWEAPMIANPDFKEWIQKKIPNPAYKGVWVHPEVPNPAFVDDKTVYNVCEDGCTGVGFELWQVQAGSIFDDIYVGDSVEEAEAFAKSTFEKKKDAEKKKYDEIEAAKKAEADAAAAKAKAEADAKAEAEKATKGGDDDVSNVTATLCIIQGFAPIAF